MNSDVELLKKMVEIYSPTFEEEKIADFLVKEMAKLGFKTKKDEVGNAIGVIGEGKPEILIVGHIDTVPGKIPVKIEGDKLYGRGSVDAKGAMASFISAAKTVKDKKIIVVGAVCEETGGEKSSLGAKNLIGKYNPDYLIIGEPSGWNGITLGYKGDIRLEYFLEQELSHGASKEETAIDKSIEFVEKIKKIVEEFNQGKKVFDSLQMKCVDFNSNCDGFKERVELALRFRLPLDYPVEELEKIAEKEKGDAEIKFEGHTLAFKASKSTKLVSSFLKAIRKQGGEPKFKVKTGTSDMNILGPAYEKPIVTYGSGNSDLDHTPNEHASIEEYLKSIEVLKEVLKEL